MLQVLKTAGFARDMSLTVSDSVGLPDVWVCQICNFPMGEFHPKKGYFLGSPKFRQSEGAHTPGAYPHECGSLPLMGCVWAFGVMVE